MLETVAYRSLQDVVVRAGGRFPDTQFFLSKAPDTQFFLSKAPDTQFFLSKAPDMPYVLGRDLYRLLPRRGRHG